MKNLNQTAQQILNLDDNITLMAQEGEEALELHLEMYEVGTNGHGLEDVVAEIVELVG